MCQNVLRIPKSLSSSIEYVRHVQDNHVFCAQHLVDELHSKLPKRSAEVLHLLSRLAFYGAITRIRNE